MLQENLTPNLIYTLKLNSGEEVITKLVSSDMLNYTVSKPLVCVLSPNGMGLTQWVMTASLDHNFTIPKNAVMTINRTRKDIADQYITSTTGIAPASAGILPQ